MTKPRIWAVVALVVSMSGYPSSAHAQPVPVVEPVVLEEMVHDPNAFTQGLEISGETLFEGTGLAGASQLRELDPVTGELRRAVPVPNNYFAEGITVVGDRLWQLTYRDGVAVEWDAATLAPVREVPISGEGWGLCHDGSRLVRSDGTHRLSFQSPGDLTEIGGIDVTLDGRPVTGLNELECVDGQVWANVWPTDMIVRIDPETGAVGLVVDASGLRDRGIPDQARVLNGIAHVQGAEFLLTGKDWPKMFRVRLAPNG